MTRCHATHTPIQEMLTEATRLHEDGIRRREALLSRLSLGTMPPVISEEPFYLMPETRDCLIHPRRHEIRYMPESNEIAFSTRFPRVPNL